VPQVGDWHCEESSACLRRHSQQERMAACYLVLFTSEKAVKFTSLTYEMGLRFRCSQLVCGGE